MSYTPTTWVDGETPVNAENLNNIEQGIKTLENEKLASTELEKAINDALSKVDADPAGTAESKVSEHNMNTAAHNDLRLELKRVSDQLATFLDSDDTTLDQLSELIAGINSNKTLIESVTTGKVNVADIVNNLTTNVANKPLSSAQGVVLKGLIDTLSASMSNYQPKGNYAEKSDIPTKVSQLQNDKNYLTEHQDISHLLPREELPEAVEEALGQAKDSGEFDGTSVTVKSVSESTEDGGSNVVTFSDGKTLTLKNGNKGNDGARGTKIFVSSYTPVEMDYISVFPFEEFPENQLEVGDLILVYTTWYEVFDILDDGYATNLIADAHGEPGYNPEKGVDYFTEEDVNEIVRKVIEELRGNPVYGYVDENNNIVVQGNLADGSYYVKYEMEDGSTLDIGNLVLDSKIYYSVTTNPTNCTINSSTMQVVEYGSYSATITANSGYSLSSVTVTMGGTDITSSAYSNGVVTIDSVTGDVIITAKAVENAATTYTITNNLTNCANSNSATVVEEGSAYNATITANDGYELGSVSVTMGGSAVTATSGVINIASVTGNIVITATATEVAEAYKNWIKYSENADGSRFVGTNGEAGYKTNTRLGTSDGGERTQAGNECTGFIPVTINDTLYFKNVVITTATNETTCFYDSAHALISGGGSSTSTLLGTMDGSVTVIKLSDIKAGAPANNPDKIAYVRISANEINANSIITKNQPIE